jgi:hypothetical protein
MGANQKNRGSTESQNKERRYSTTAYTATLNEQAARVIITSDSGDATIGAPKRRGIRAFPLGAAFEAGTVIAYPMMPYSDIAAIWQGISGEHGGEFTIRHMIHEILESHGFVMGPVIKGLGPQERNRLYTLCPLTDVQKEQTKKGKWYAVAEATHPYFSGISVTIKSAAKTTEDQAVLAWWAEVKRSYPSFDIDFKHHQEVTVDADLDTPYSV